MNQVFYWLIDRLIDFLASTNPARAQKAEAIRAEAARLDAEFEKFTKEVEATNSLNEELQLQLNDNLSRQKAFEKAIALSKAEFEKRKADRARLSDADRVRLDL